MYEGHDKYDKFVTQLQTIKRELRELCDSPGMELHGTIYTFMLFLGGDMSFQGGAFGHAGAASTFFCFICDMARQNMSLTPSDYQRKGITPPTEKTTVVAAMLAHAFGEEYGLTNSYLCPWCGLRVKCHGDLPPSDTQQGRQDYQFSHFGQRHLCPLAMMMIDPVDMIGDTLHAGIQIFPHVLWHTVYNRCNSATTAQAAMRALEVIGLPGREIKVQNGKGKNPTKADLPALIGPEVSKVAQGHGVVLDAVLPPSDPNAAKTYKVWEAYDYMSAGF
jgi:hypothetical protein